MLGRTKLSPAVSALSFQKMVVSRLSVSLLLPKSPL